MNIRPVTPADLPDIVRLNAVCGFPPRSKAGWDWVLFHNPHQGSEPAGYVAERGGRVIAFLGCFAHALHANGQPATMINGHTFVSDLTSPGLAKRLIEHLFATSGSDGAYTLNNNALSARIYKHCGMQALWGDHGRHYAEKRRNLVRLVISAGLRRLAKKDRVHTFLSKREWFATQPKSGDAPTGEGIRKLDPRNAADAAALDAFDTALLSSGKTYGARSAENWVYRMQDPDRARPTEIHALFDQHGIAGLVATSLSKDTAFGVVTLEIEDLICRPEAEHALGALLPQVDRCARHARAHRILWRILPSQDISTLAETAGYIVRTRGHDSCHVRRLSERDIGEWSIGGFDGDFWFALRRPPER